jgi:hypothetical protein
VHTPTLAIGKCVELDLPYTRIQLLIEWLIPIFKLRVDLRILLHHQPASLGTKPA